MTVERIHRIARVSAELLFAAGIILAEFARQYALGMALVCLALIAGGAAFAAWMIHEEEKRAIEPLAITIGADCTAFEKSMAGISQSIRELGIALRGGR